MSPSDINQAFLPNKVDEGKQSRQPDDDDIPLQNRELGVAHNWRSSWQAPITMIGFLLLGGAMAVGHHYFYKSLHNTRTPDNFSQQLNTAYGTAFAFIAKACMVAAVVCAYTQYIWFDFRKKLTKISTIDSTFTATSSIISMLDPHFLWHCKTSAALAAIVWLLPLSAIVTPSTLSVRPTTDATEFNLAVPTLNFSTFTEFREGDAVKAPLTRLSKLVMSGVRIPPIEPFIANTSYPLEIIGPSLRCGEPSPDVVTNIDAIFDETGDKVVNDTGSMQQMGVYMAFTPFTPATYSGRAWPLENLGEVKSNSSDWTRFVQTCLKGTVPACSLLGPTVAGIPDNTLEGHGETIDTSNALWMRFGDDRLVCSVQKTRYRLTFDARNPLTALQSYTYTQEGVFRADSDDNIGSIVAIQPLLDILRGSTYMASRWCYLREMQMMKCTTALDYVISETSIHETALTAMVYAKAGEIREKTWAVAQNLSSGVAPPKENVLPPADPLEIPLTRNLTLREVIEEMSRNMTLSYFSDARYLSPNRTEAGVTTTVTVNIYRYNMRNLILAYSIAFGASALAVIMGLHVFIANGFLNCTANFSTILSTTIRNPGLGSLIERASTTPDAKMNASSIVVSPKMLNIGLKFGVLIDQHAVDMERQEVESMEATPVEAFGAPGQVL